MSPLPRTLLPDTAAVAADGMLTIGGCRVDELAAEHGTPLFVYDEAHLRDRCREAVERVRRRAGDLRDQGVPVPGDGPPRPRGGDAARRGQRRRAARRAGRRRARRRRARCTATTRASTSCAWRVEAGVRYIVVDSFDELDRLDALHADRASPVPDVLLRITPGVHAHTHEYIATGQDDSKFGFNLGNGDAARAVERARRSSSVDLVGLHCHIGSNVFAAESFGRAAEVMAALRRAARPARARARRRARRRLRRGRGGADDHRVGRRCVLDACRSLGVTCGRQRRAGPGDRRRRGRHRVHRRHDQARSPACGRTSPSTAG